MQHESISIGAERALAVCCLQMSVGRSVGRSLIVARTQSFSLSAALVQPDTARQTQLGRSLYYAACR